MGIKKTVQRIPASPSAVLTFSASKVLEAMDSIHQFTDKFVSEDESWHYKRIFYQLHHVLAVIEEESDKLGANVYVDNKFIEVL